MSHRWSLFAGLNVLIYLVLCHVGEIGRCKITAETKSKCRYCRLKSCIDAGFPQASTLQYLLEGVRKKVYHVFAFNSFTAKVALMHPKKIVQSQLRRRLAKAASELGLHYFLFHLAKTHKFTNIVDL